MNAAVLWPTCPCRLERLEQKSKFVAFVVDGRLKLGRASRRDLEASLADLGFPRAAALGQGQGQEEVGGLRFTHCVVVVESNG
jgi:hypothetical protein